MEPMLPSVPPSGGPHAEWIAGRVKVLLSHYYQPEIAPEVEEEGLADWIEILMPFPRATIDVAGRQYLRDEPRRRPTPGAIHELASSLMPKPAVVARIEPPPEPPRELPSLERRQEMAAEVDALLARMKARA